MYLIKMSIITICVRARDLRTLHFHRRAAFFTNTNRNKRASTCHQAATFPVSSRGIDSHCAPFTATTRTAMAVEVTVNTISGEEQTFHVQDADVETLSSFKERVQKAWDMNPAEFRIELFFEDHRNCANTLCEHKDEQVVNDVMKTGPYSSPGMLPSLLPSLS